MSDTGRGREPAEETPDMFGAYPRLERSADRSLSRRRSAPTPRPTGDILLAEGEPRRDFLVLTRRGVADVRGLRHAGTAPARRTRPGPVPRRTRRAGRSDGVRDHNRYCGTASCSPFRDDRLRQHVARDTALGDLILRAYLQRRTMLIGLGAGFRIIGSHYSPDTRRLRDFACPQPSPAPVDRPRHRRAAETPCSPALGVPVTDTPVVIWRGTRGASQPRPTHIWPA